LALLTEALVPTLGLRDAVADLVKTANLPQTVLRGALGFLLFAAAYNVDLRALWSRKWAVLALATAGVAIATMLLGLAMWAVFALTGLGISLAWCLTFGALVAPTDPVAVAGVLQRAGLPPGLKAIIAGESLFNDGVGVVLFTTLLGIASASGPSPQISTLALRLLIEAAGAGLLGIAAGALALAAMRSVDQANLELMISLALVMLTYSIAELVGVSAPIAVAATGLLVGHFGPRRAMSANTRRQLETFWSLVDGLLNAVLFLTLGLELVIIQFTWAIAASAAAAILLSLLCRIASVLPTGLAIQVPWRGRLAGLAILSWGGVRGGVSVALALTLPSGPARDPLLAACYAIVLFTVLVQGLTLEPLARRVRPALDAALGRCQSRAG
jgi:CPA1 family monovalent cation:H+ antiporter